MSETLGAIAVEIGADLKRLNEGMNQALRSAVSKGTQAGEAFGQNFGTGFGSRALTAFSRVDDAIRRVQTSMRLMGDVSGVSIAARYQSIQVGLQGVTGSAKDAKKVLDDLSDLGGNTAFNTAELVGFSQGLLGVGVTAQRIKGDMTALADAVATVNGGTEGLGRLANNMLEIKVSPHPEMRDVKEIMRMGLNLDKVVGSALGKQMKTGQGLSTIQGMSGEKAYDTLITGFDKTYGGNARKMADGTLGGVTQNLGEAFQTMMLPTGQALIPVLTDISKGLRSGAEAAKHFNELTGGGAGMAGMIGLAIVGFRHFIGVGVSTVSTVNRAVGAVERLSFAVEGLAVASDTAGSGVRRLGAGSGKDGVRGEFGGAAETAIGIGIPLGVETIIGYYANKKEKGAAEGPAGDKDRIEAARLRGGQAGAGIGGTLGMIGFLGGPLAGAGTVAAGTIVGMAAGGYFAENNAKNEVKKDAATTAQQADADAANKLANALNSTNFKMIGGGNRARDAAGVLAAEYTMARTYRTGLA